MIVDEIELAGAAKEFGDMQRGEDVAVERRVFVETDRNDRDELALKMRVARRKERYVEPARGACRRRR